MPRLRARRASLRDLRFLTHLRVALYEELLQEAGRPGEARAIASDARRYAVWLSRMLRARRVIAWVVEAPDGRPISGGILYLQETALRPGLARPVRPRIHSMYTEPEFRGRGAASLVIEAAASWARQHGYDRIALQSSPKAVPLYRRKGFHPVDEMVLELTPRRTGRTKPRGSRAGHAPG